VLRSCDDDERRSVLGQLRAQMRTRRAVSVGRPLTTAELKDFAACDGVTVGAHTMQHRALRSLPASARLLELRESKEFLEGVTGRRVDFFSYPFGRARDVGADAARAVAHAGYRAACTTMQEPVRVGQSVYRLPRLTVANEPGAELVRRVAQLLDD